MEHLERSVAGVDDIPVIEESGHRASRDLSDHRHACDRNSVDEDLGDVVARISIGPEDRLAVLLGDQRGAHRCHEVGSFDAVDRSLVELVQAADVVGVAVGRHSEERVADLVLDEVSERRETERGVDDEITVTSLHVPHVAPQQRVDVRLGDQRDAVTHAPHDPPGIGDRQLTEIGHSGHYGAPRATNPSGIVVTSSRSCCRSSGRRSSCRPGSSGRRTACRSERRSPGSSAPRRQAGARPG